MTPSDYHAFTQHLTDKLQADPRVLGLVLVGSTAQKSHAPDAYSDHDFFVITKRDRQEHFRTHFDWLPEHERIVLTVRETAHGLKALYDDGHLLEFAVFDTEEIALAKVNDYAIAFDRGSVTSAIQAIATHAQPTHTDHDLTFHRGMFLCLLVVGAGRAARGEILSGQLFIRSHALQHLLTLLAHTLTAPNKSALDNLDPFRRFEQVFPDVGAQINTAIAQDPIAAATALLAIFHDTLHDTPDYPQAAVDTVREFLGCLS